VIVRGSQAGPAADAPTSSGLSVKILADESQGTALRVRLGPVLVLLEDRRQGLTFGMGTIGNR
jgi:hypothetical protein